MIYSFPVHAPKSTYLSQEGQHIWARVPPPQTNKRKRENPDDKQTQEQEPAEVCIYRSLQTAIQSLKCFHSGEARSKHHRISSWDSAAEDWKSDRHSTAPHPTCHCKANHGQAQHLIPRWHPQTNPTAPGEGTYCS